MKSLVQHLVKQSRLSEVEAVERVDRAVCDVLRRLRKGRDVRLPGLGRLLAGATTRLDPEVRRGIRKP